MIIKTTQKGFTIIELMIATTVFSVILLLVASGLINITNAYYKGLTSSATQETARSLMQELTQDFELSGGFYKKLATVGGYNGFCIGNNLYTYQIDKQIPSNGDGHALVVRSVPGCDINPAQKPDSFSVTKSDWRELLGPNMRIHELTIDDGAIPTPKSIKITLKILSGDDDLLDLATGLCRGGKGSQFCANSGLTTYAVRRLNVY